MFCFNSIKMKHKTLTVFALLLLFQNGSCVKKKNRNVMIVEEEAAEKSNNVETTTDVPNTQSVQTSYYGFGGPVNFVPHSFQQSSQVHGFDGKNIKDIELFNSLPNKVKEIKYAKMHALNKATSSQKTAELTNANAIPDSTNSNYAEEATNVNYGSQPDYIKYGSQSTNMNFGAKTSDENIASQPSHENFGSGLSNANYRSQQPSANYASDLSNANFEPQQANFDYESETSNVHFGSQQPNAKYGSEEYNAHYGSQRPNSNYATKASNTNYGSQQPIVNYGSPQSITNYGSETLNGNYGSEQSEINQANEPPSGNYLESSINYADNAYNSNYRTESSKQPEAPDSPNNKKHFTDPSKRTYGQETANDNYVPDPLKRNNMDYSVDKYAVQSPNNYDLTVPDNTDPNLMRFTSSVAKPLKPISPMSQKVQQEFEKFLMESYNLDPITSRNSLKKSFEDQSFPSKSNKDYEQNYFDLKSMHTGIDERPYYYSERVQSFGNPGNSLNSPYNSRFKPSKPIGQQNYYDEAPLTSPKPPETLSSSSFVEFYKNKYKNREEDDHINEFEPNHDSFYGTKPIRALNSEPYWQKNIYGDYGNIYNYASAFHKLQNDERKKLGYNKVLDSYDYKPWSKNPYPDYSKDFIRQKPYENQYVPPDSYETANSDYNFAISKPYKTRFKNEEELLPLRNRDMVKPYHTYSKHVKLSGKYPHRLKSNANSYDGYNVAPDKWNKLRHGDSYNGRTKHLAYSIEKPVLVGVPHPVLVPVPQPYPVQVPVPRPVAVPIVKVLRVPIEQQVPYPVYKNVPYPVEKLVPVLVEKEVPEFKPYPVPVPHDRPSPLNHAPSRYADAPPRYADAPPRYADVPSRYADAPPRYAESPPSYADAPPRYANKPPRYADVPSRYADAPYRYGDDPLSYVDMPPRYADATPYETPTRRRRIRRPPREQYGNYRSDHMRERSREENP